MLSSLLPNPWKEVLIDHHSQIDDLGAQLQKRADQGERILPFVIGFERPLAVVWRRHKTDPNRRLRRSLAKFAHQILST